MPNEHPTTRPPAGPAGTYAEQIRTEMAATPPGDWTIPPDALRPYLDPSVVAAMERSQAFWNAHRPGAIISDKPLRIGRPETFITGRPNLERVRTEGSVRRAIAPRCYRLSRWRRWRWTVTRYYHVATTLPGVEGRIHVIADSGHTFTKLGAYIAAGRKLVTR